VAATPVDDVSRVAASSSGSCPEPPVSFVFDKKIVDSGDGSVTCRYTRPTEMTLAASSSVSYSCPEPPASYTFSSRAVNICIYTRQTVTDCNDRSTTRIRNGRSSYTKQSKCRARIKQVQFGLSVWPFKPKVPNPGKVILVNVESRKCATREGAATALSALVEQRSCSGRDEQEFRIVPAPDAAGYFRIVTAHAYGNRPSSLPSGRMTEIDFFPMCAHTVVDGRHWSLLQVQCQDVDSMRFRLVSWNGSDIYTIRSKADLGRCWKVPESTSDGRNLAYSICRPSKKNGGWYRWQIRVASG
jgi:hypothetical protein